MTSQARRHPKERLREEILAVAEEIVARDGLSALQARRVASEAGCSVGSIYNAFGDLDELVLAVNEATLDLMSAPLSGTFKASLGKGTEEQLIALAFAYRDFALANLPRWRAVFEHRLPPNKDVPDAYANKRAHLLALIEETIETEIGDEAHRGHAARALFAAVHGIILLGFDNKLAPYNAAEIESEIRFIVQAASAGLTRARTD